MPNPIRTKYGMTYLTGGTDFFSPFLFFNVERLFIPKAILLGQIRPCSRTCNRPCSRNFSRELSKISMKPGCDVFHCDGCHVMTFKLLYFESHGN